MLLAALVAVLCVIAATEGLALGLLVAIGCGLIGWVAGWRIGLLWVATGLGVVLITGARIQQDERAELDLLNRGEFEAAGKVVEDARGGSAFWVAPVQLDSGAMVWWQGRGRVPIAGARVSAWGSAEALQGPRNPGEFDRELWLRRKGVVAQFRQGFREGEVDTDWSAKLGSQVRQEFRRRLTLGLEDESEQAQVIRAMVMGDRPSDGDDLMEVFRKSGTLHVFSVSGLHVAMVGSIGWLLLSWIGVPRRWAVLGLVPVVFAYAWITGANPPAMRAAWMASLFFGAFVLRRRPNLLNALGAVLWAGLLWDGRQLYQPGVQLSYGVVAVIALGQAITAKAFVWMARPELYLPLQLMTRSQQWWLGLRQKVAQSLGVSLAAGVGSAPLTVLHFGLVTPISIIASVALVPLVFVLLGTALGSAFLSIVSEPAAKGLNGCNGRLASVCVGMADGFSSVPGGHFRWGLDTRPKLIIYDLGYGDQAVCFDGGKGEGAVMIDCGGSRSFQYQVAPSLRKLGVQPDSVVLTHPDGGHLGGGSQVWNEWPLRQVLLPVKDARSADYQEWADASHSPETKRYAASDFRDLDFPDGAVLEIIHVPRDVSSNSRADQRVVVCRLVWHGWRILFMSDAGMDEELEMLEQGIDLPADLIVAGKNRSDLSLIDEFVEKVNPRVMVLTNAEFPEGERRSEKRIGYWRSKGVAVMDQSESGGVVITLGKNKELCLDGHVSGESVVLNPR